MNRSRAKLPLLLALTIVGCGRDASRLTAPGPIEPAAAYIRLGAHQQFVTTLPGDSVQWSVSGPPGSGYVSRSGIYYSPLRSSGLDQVTVSATTQSLAVSAVVHLTAWQSDTLDCYSEEQLTDLPGYGEYVPVEELPEALVRVHPIYPDDAREAGVSGTVNVVAHVCACGQVQEMRATVSIPLLDDAAFTAVGQWLFKPALSNGRPVAIWVTVPVKFTLH